MIKRNKSGLICPASKIWIMEISWKERTIVEGDLVPSTERPREVYSLVRKTQH